MPITTYALIQMSGRHEPHETRVHDSRASDLVLLSPLTPVPLNPGFEQEEGQEVLRALVGAYLSHIGSDTTDGPLMDEAIAGLGERPPEEVAAVYLQGLWFAVQVINRLLQDVATLVLDDRQGTVTEAGGKMGPEIGPEMANQWRELVRFLGAIDVKLGEQAA